jgi:hypothetical protein
VLRIEFTIEPFIEGRPGPHVMSAVEAVRAFGIDVEFGPFGSLCTVPAAQVGHVSNAIVAAAFANGATHLNLDITLVDGSAGTDTPGAPA